jgi:signal peptidase I
MATDPTPEVAPAPPRALADEEPRQHRPFWKELPVLVVIAFVIALLIKTFLLQAFYIPSGSMEPTLNIGDRVLVEKVSYRFGEPERGDVVVFEKDLASVIDPELSEDDRSVMQRIGDAFRGLFGFPTGGSQDFIKRVVAVGGDEIEGHSGKVFVNGEEIDEPYLADETQTGDFGSLKIPEGMIFVMGDNRANSDDSRNFGPVPADAVVGRAFVLIWPPSNISSL